MPRILVTGGCGFIGHHFVEAVLKKTDWQIIVLDRLNYASNGFDRLRDIAIFDDKRVFCLAADFSKSFSDGVVKEIGDLDYIVHMGAETHVDNSIIDPEPFVMSNVLGTMHLLNFARKQTKLKKMMYFSTDEVFGPAPEGVFYKEWDRYNSGNPYAAAKAGGEELCLAYANTYKVPVFIGHTMNVYGERQHPEKFIPLCIKKAVNNEVVTIHANKDKTKAGSRHWIHARNVASAVLFLLEKGKAGEKYNIVGEKEVDNLEMAQLIFQLVDKKLRYEMTDFHSSRPGHDLRYALDGTKLRQMGWTHPLSFEKSLERTVRWFVNPKNKKWLNL